MKGRNWKRLISIFLGAIGILFVLYPIVSQLYEKSEMEKVIDQYWQSIKESEQMEELYAAGIDYNSSLINGSNKQEYTKLLLLEDMEIMGVLSIPQLKLNLPIYHGTEDSSLSKGVGHLEGTSLPLKGDGVHVVLCGHSGMPDVKVFDHIDELEIGDLIYVYVLGNTMVYKVINCVICLPNDVEKMIHIQNNKNILTLITCTPYGINSHRLLVTAELEI